MSSARLAAHLTRRRAVIGVIAALAITASPAITSPAFASSSTDSPPTAVPSAVLAGTTPAAVAPRPKVPTGLPAGIEWPAPYVASTSCDPAAKPGSTALGRLLVATYPGTSFGVGRACGTSPDSEHKEGRAIDWMNSVRVPKEAAQATALINWMMNIDYRGRPFAMARRLGVMYLIWNNKIWSVSNASAGWRAYQNCATHPEVSYDTTCHRNHVHISLSWEGARARTSFWDKTVAVADYGPCRPRDLNWAAPRTTPNPARCASYAKVTAPAGSSTLMRSLVTYSGLVLRTGSTGTPVRAVQQAVGATIDGNYGPATAASVSAWQGRHAITKSGVMTQVTWRAMLKVYKPA